MNEKVLEVKNLKTYFYTDEGEIPAVDGVDFSLERGETLAIVGESGCGKSVTSLSILRLIATPPGKIVDGEILYNGRDLLKLSEKEMRSVRGNDISMIFQEPMTSLNPVFTVGKQIMESLIYHQNMTKEQARERAIEMLRLVDIPNPEKCINNYPHNLSGGMRQRVMIAMALACNPKVLIADEPTTALDVTVQKQVIKLLNDLQAKLGFAMIFVSHDLALVAEVAHNITVMYAGQVIEQAPTKELLTNPIHEYTRGLLGSVLSIESGSGRLHQVPGAVPSPRDFPKGDRFAPRSSHPRIGLDTRPVFKRVPGTEHFYSELPDEVLKANGLTPHAEVM